MTRIKAQVLSEKRAIAIVEQRRKNQGGEGRVKNQQKRMKLMKTQIQESRVAAAKSNIKALKDWRKDKKRDAKSLEAAIKGKSGGNKPKRPLHEQQGKKRQKAEQKAVTQEREIRK